MAYSDIILADNPVNYWRLGESSGNAIDEMGEHDLLWTGTPVYSAAGALVNDADTAMTLDGSTEYASKAIAGYRSGDTQGSVELWFKTLSSADHMFFASGDTASTLYAICLYIDNGQIVFGVNEDGWDRVTTSGDPLNDGLYHHVVVSSNGSAWTVFIGGQAVSVAPLSGEANTGGWFSDVTSRDNIVIGALKRTTVVAYMSGSIDEVAVYNYPLTAQQVLTHYQAGMDTLSRVSGTITDIHGNPAARTVRLYTRSTGALIAETTSDGTTGAYEIATATTEPVTVIALDTDLGSYNAIVHDRVIPQ